MGRHNQTQNIFLLGAELMGLTKIINNFIPYEWNTAILTLHILPNAVHAIQSVWLVFQQIENE